MLEQILKKNRHVFIPLDWNNATQVFSTLIVMIKIDSFTCWLRKDWLATKSSTQVSLGYPRLKIVQKSETKNKCPNNRVKQTNTFIDGTTQPNICSVIVHGNYFLTMDSTLQCWRGYLNKLNTVILAGTTIDQVATATFTVSEHGSYLLSDINHINILSTHRSYESWSYFLVHQ